MTRERAGQQTGTPDTATAFPLAEGPSCVPIDLSREGAYSSLYMSYTLYVFM